MESISLNEVNPTNSDIIKALDAATFLRKSGINQLTLKNIWDLSDPNCLGYLDKKSFFISLKLIAMVQNGKPLNITDIKVSVPPPIISDDVLSCIDWSISKENVENYKVVYNSLNPIDGKLAGSKVKPYMVNSKLPVELLTKVWDLSDIDQDGFLNMKEFILSCHLIAKASQGLLLPPQLPSELLNFNPLETSVQQLNLKLSPISSSPQSFISEAEPSTIPQWIVPTEDRAVYEANFIKLDKDNDGLVNGFDVKDTMMQSGLPQNVLAHIWNLCDIKGTGMLNSEQFALANYFIKQKQSGLELPMQLAPHMVPPTLRPKPTESTSSENVNGSQTSTGNKELDNLNEEIKQLQMEKVKYESEVTSEEASLRLKQSEIKSIQNEIETLSQMLKQLENQKNDASKRLDDLNSQVDSLNKQYLEQKKKIDEQDGDLNLKRKEFEDLKNEEARLESKLTLSKGEAEQASKNATDTQLEISQIKTNYVELEEYERRVNEMISDYDHAIENQDFVKIASLLPRSITPPPFVELESAGLDEFKAEFNADPFAGEDPFKDDPFNSAKAADAFGASDNFANFDAFGNGTSNK
ncbi:PREDICTED: epidermal growth factor receptor substrate 15-like 1, partial [Rhagoletis zephyria]|uniref:epidermal growth factor receptor substrate 15-like 1 n=1 Tax=Rhagoletis zephyria TaxID=28612 RepID=UPI0008119BB4